MAALLARNAFALTRRTLSPRIASSVKSYSDIIPPLYDPAEGKTASKDVSLPDGLGGSVGIERWEMIQEAKGIEDPYDLHGVKLIPGTKEQPTIVRSTEPTRTIGCLCDEDATTIRYTRLCLGETSRCQCGHFFSLVPEEGNA
ncbi:cytochrome c oxidase subunit 5B, mitochondrial-like [Watersipora subatra]|uniref:cytochrome c oxidase subunit 5B, mitochondrial-like n=1 Tax=Watersipora subatra TaxID=2589382 RepID=UPI00355AF01E